MSRTRRLRPLVALIALLGTTGVVACGDSIGQDAEFVKDSWKSPTDHGELEFGGAANPGEFSEDARYHAWTFALTDAATVSIDAELAAQNLDSVMYLYKKQENGLWGAYIAKNDDSSELGLGSRIEKSLAAGEYQVKVKAAKKLMTGSFTVGRLRWDRLPGRRRLLWSRGRRDAPGHRLQPELRREATQDSHHAHREQCPAVSRG